MNKKILIILLILICLAIIAGGIYIYSRNLREPGNLTSYMPRETELYIEFNLKDKNLEEFYANNFRAQARFEKLIQDSGFLGDLSKDLIEQASKISLLVITENNEQHKVWLVAGDNIHKFHALLPTGYFESILNSKTIALSPDRDVLRKIRFFFSLD